MSELEAIFKKLKSVNIPKELEFSVEKIGSFPNHKIGITQEGYPIILIKGKGAEGENLMGYNLELIEVLFNVDCHFLDDRGSEKKGKFSIIKLKSESISHQNYFLNICQILMEKLGQNPTIIKLRREVQNLIDLFTKLSKPPKKTILGLWGELLVIEQAIEPSSLIKAWHVSPTDKYDFNDGIDKLEVKTTEKNVRVHHFSYSQLVPNLSSQLFIISIITSQTNVGVSISDLMNKISKKIRMDERMILHGIVADSLGSNFDRGISICFDYNMAKDSLKTFLSSDIPNIPQSSIPKEVTNIHFECNLTGINECNYKKIKSKLFRAIR